MSGIRMRADEITVRADHTDGRVILEITNVMGNATVVLDLHEDSAAMLAQVLAETVAAFEGVLPRSVAVRR
jgi:hypothetical protein